MGDGEQTDDSSVEARDQRAAGAVAPAVSSYHLINPLCVWGGERGGRGKKKKGERAQLAGSRHRQEMIRLVTQYHLVGLALFKAWRALNGDMT